MRCRAIEAARSCLLQLGKCILLLLTGLFWSGRDREACPEDLRFLVELEDVVELLKLFSSSILDTHVAIAARTEAETVGVNQV